MRIGNRKERFDPNLPPDNAGGTTLKSMLPVQGDWFILEITYEPNGTARLCLSRVTLWALAGGVDADADDSVVGIDARGMPQDDPISDVFYVCGTDLAPNGSVWNDVYRSVLPSLLQVRDVTHLFNRLD